jgi:hypothetical protein
MSFKQWKTHGTAKKTVDFQTFFSLAAPLPIHAQHSLPTRFGSHQYKGLADHEPTKGQ